MLLEAIAVTWMLATLPAWGAIAPDGDATHVHKARPGEHYRGVLVIRNPGNEAVQVKVYQTDYSFSADGSNRFDTPGTLDRSNAGWLRLGREQVSIAPAAVASIDYEVHVPDEPVLTGTYWSVVMVQELSGAEASGRPRAGMQLTQTLRHAIQIVTEIGDSGSGAVAFRNARMSGAAENRLFQVDLENTGERWLRTDMWLELHDAEGRLLGRFPGKRRRTFPGTSVRNDVPLGSAPPGRYLGLLVADGGRNDLFGMQIELDLR
jgi:hypothetical protein